MKRSVLLFNTIFFIYSVYRGELGCSVMPTLILTPTITLTLTLTITIAPALDDTRVEASQEEHLLFE